MLEKQHEPIAFELAQSVKIQNQKILYLCDSDKEARLIKNELALFLMMLRLDITLKEKYCHMIDFQLQIQSFKKELNY